MSTQKTLPTAVSVEEYLAGLDARRSAEGAELVEIFRDATGAPPTMWGPSIVGFGEYAYRYESGHSGVAMRTGFAVRKAKLSLYGLQSHPDAQALLAQLGPHTTGVDCVYVTRLAAVDTTVLRQLVALAWEFTQSMSNATSEAKSGDAPQDV